jgi:hypothetical protein
MGYDGLILVSSCDIIDRALRGVESSDSGAHPVQYTRRLSGLIFDFRISISSLFGWNTPQKLYRIPTRGLIPPT